MTPSLARSLVRALDLKPNDRVGLFAQEAEVRAQLTSLILSAGAEIGETNLTGMVIADSPTAAPLISSDLRAALSILPPKSSVVFLLPPTSEETLPRTAADQQARRLGLAGVAKSETIEGHAVVCGLRRPRTGRDRVKALVGIGHTMKPSILVGRSGLTAGLIEATREAVTRHGLIKVKLTPQAELEKHEALQALAWASGCDLVKRVGRVGLLFRADVPFEPAVQRSARRT